MTGRPWCEMCQRGLRESDHGFGCRNILWRDCDPCGGDHQVCADCAKRNRIETRGRGPGRVAAWAVCPDAVRVAIELMRPERPPIPPFVQASFDQLQRDIAKTIRNCFVSTMEDATDIAEVFKDVVKATGVSTGDFAAALTAVREAAHAEIGP